MVEWEYKRGVSPAFEGDGDIVTWLNTQGKDGWELVIWNYKWSGTFEYLFKRRTQETSPW